MLLLQLPSEILIQIFEHVGSYCFRSDLSRLTVCKQWSNYALTACYREFDMSRDTLRRLMFPADMESSLSHFKDKVEVLDLAVEDFEGPPSNSAHLARLERAAWVKELSDHIFHLAFTLKDSPKLRILRFQATSESRPVTNRMENRDHHLVASIRIFFSIRSLTSLELDLSIIQHQSRPLGEMNHVCPNIAMRLTTLRRLRLRMRSICTDVLKPQEHSGKLLLNEVIINLSLSNNSPYATSATHAMCCGTPPAPVRQLKADMEKQLQDLVAQMAAPKTVRILTHMVPSLQLRAFDVLTGRSVVLGQGADWEDDGEVIEG